MKLFELADCTLGYKGTKVLEGFSWAVQRGERWVLLGNNGAGKTTLIKTILGLIPPLAGKISFWDNEAKSCQKISIGYLPQSNQIDKNFPISVREVIDSGLMGLKLSRGERKARIDELLEQIKLSHLANTTIGQLSGGQLQRVLLARAMASKPELLVLDEPTSFLDSHSKDDFEYFLRYLVGEDCTILLVTHDEFLPSLSDWISLRLGG